MRPEQASLIAHKYSLPSSVWRWEMSVSQS